MRWLGLAWAFVAICGAAAPVFGSNVDGETAESAARAFLAAAQTADQPVVTEPSTQLSAYAVSLVDRLQNPAGDTIAYVITLSPTGYVVLSSDTDIRPVVAWSFASDLDIEEHPGNAFLHLIQWDMGNRLAELGNVPQSVKEANRDAWQELAGGDPAAVYFQDSQEWGPLLEDPSWHQDSPYNDYCPCFTPVFGICTNRAVVGCVATSMAQIINYWQYPSSVSFDVTDRYETKTELIAIDADHDERLFPSFPELNDMLESIDYDGSNEEKAALSFACGVSVHMNYKDNGWWIFSNASGAWHQDAAAAFTGKFGYVTAECICLTGYGCWGECTEMSVGDFYAALQENMKRGHPCILGISSSQDIIAHSIVVEGYRNTGEYWLNYGWGNFNDGWYSPPPPSLPGQPFSSGYNVIDNAVVNIRPTGLIPGVGIDVALVMDKSGSMDSADKLPTAKSAADYFVEASRPGDQVAVAAFSADGELVAPLTEIEGEDPYDVTKQYLKSEIDGIVAGGSTNFGAGLEIAYDELDGSAFAQEKFALLMSNGQHNTGTYTEQVQAFEDKGWPIYTIGFGSDANEESLQGIADDTSGKYYFADPATLATVYDLIRADMAGNSLLAVMQWLLQQGQIITHWLPAIDPLTTLLHFLLNWGGSDVDLILIRPDGSEVTPEDAALDPDITYHSTETYAFYTVSNPEPGSWGARIVGTDLPNPEVVTLSVTADSSMVCTFYGFQAAFSSGDVIPIAVQLRERDHSAIVGAHVEVEIASPSGSTQSLVLLDDGAHGDLDAADGIYGSTYSDTAVAGYYGLDVCATGDYSAGPFSVRLIGQVLVGSPPLEPRSFDDDFEYGSQSGMNAAGWTCQGLWHLTTEAESSATSSNITPFPSSTHSVHFCDPVSGTYSTAAATSAIPMSSRDRARRGPAELKAQSPKNFGELVSPAISVTGGTQAELRFDHYRQVEYYTSGSYDRTYVQVRFDEEQWDTVWELDSTTPSQSTWMEAGPIPIAVPLGASIMRVKFVFDSVDGYFNSFLGWLIDDVSISGAGPATVSITTQTLPAGTVSQPYSMTLSAAGGTPPYAWSATGLPGGLSLDPATGALKGTPTAAGVYSVTASATDSANATALHVYQLAISPVSGVAFYLEDFLDSSGWVMTGLWHVPTTLQCIDLVGHGPAAYYGIDATCNYDVGGLMAGELGSPEITVSSKASLELRFDYYRQVEYYTSGSYDRTYVQVRFDEEQWHTVWELDSTTPSQSAWMEAGPIPIAVPLGASIMRVKFVFDSVDDHFNSFLGWLIDDVSISGAGPATVSITTAEGLPHAAPGLMTVLSVPNPLRSRTGAFVVRGLDSELMRVEVYDLSGCLVWQGEGSGNELHWSGEKLDGTMLANGVYLYRVSVLVSGVWLPSSIQKLAIVR